jgi:EcoRII C terminal/Restriction endonuclease EcoRII, N-terminal
MACRFSQVAVRSFLLLLSLCHGMRAAESSAVEAAIGDAVREGRALCKFVSPNDAGATGSHQSGLYLPKAAWPVFSSMAPVEEENRREEVEITWPDGTGSASVVTWYGNGSRSEYRLTRLGDAGRQWLSRESVGDLWVLVPRGARQFSMHVLRTDEESSALCAALGIESGARWGLYQRTPAPTGGEGPYAAWARGESQQHAAFPPGRQIAELARHAVGAVNPNQRATGRSPDERLLAWMEAEYALFREIERRVCRDEVERKFDSIEEFLAAAATLTNRRKSRAGQSLEEHVEHLLRETGIAFEAQAAIDGNVRPDILLPGKSAYDDPRHPAQNLVVLGLKTTCRDRWRQVLNEGKRVASKHLLTLQPAMSRAQLAEMRDAGLQLVVPAPLHNGYDLPEDYRLLTVGEFLAEMKRRFPR